MLRQTIPPELLLSQAPIGILQFRLDGCISYANPAFCRLIGYTEAQLHRLDNRAISHSEDFAVEVRLLQQMIDRGQQQQTLQKRYQHRSGDMIWTEVSLSLLEDSKTGEWLFLGFVTDISNRYQIEQEVQHYRAREALLTEIFNQMQTADLQTVLQLAVERLRHTLAADRVVAYQFFADNSGVCLAEDVDPVYSAMLGQEFSSDCIPPPYLDAYRDGRMWSVADVRSEALADCHQLMLEQVQVRSMIVAAIVSMDAALEPQKRKLWGLLVVHHCCHPRTWTVDEKRLLQAVAAQLATASEQTQLLQALQNRAHELEDRVSERTRSLAQALKFERLVHHLTETLRQHLDAGQVLQAAVEGLTHTLMVDRCIASLFDPQKERLTVRYECIGGGVEQQPSLIGQSRSLQELPDAYHHHFLRQDLNRVSGTTITAFDHSAAALIVGKDSTTSESKAQADYWCSQQTVSPIMDDQGLLGALTVFYRQPRAFESAEITLIEQVANQCAIALRQSYLHCQEHELRLSTDYFRSFLETSTDVFIEYDSRLRCLSINPAGSELIGLPIAAIIGKSNAELLGAASEYLDSVIQRAFSTGERVLVNHELISERGIRIFETVYTPITTPSGIVQRVIGVSRDVTEIKQEWQLLETQNHHLAETMRLKQEFIATTSHELRTPLTAVLGFSNVLLQGFFGELNPKQQDYIERIHDSGQHLLDLINDILDLSRLEADRLELDLQAISIPDVCEGVIGLMRERALNQGLNLEVDLAPGIDWMVADPRRLKQMLLNLLANAIKFTPAGTVGLKVYRQTSTDQSNSSTVVKPPPKALSERVSLAPSGIAPVVCSLQDMIHFSIWDTGIGISAADQQRLFSPFSQIDSSLARKHQGTGLGLVITRKLAELHGGTITLESSQNQGACFTISLPFNAVN